MKIIPCRCPKCGTTYEDYWDLAEPDIVFDSDIILVYPINCEKCGYYFEYQEIYELKNTMIRES